MLVQFDKERSCEEDSSQEKNRMGCRVVAGEHLRWQKSEQHWSKDPDKTIGVKYVTHPKKGYQGVHVM